MNKAPSFKFKTNVPATILFQSNVMKEGDGEFGHWKMYSIQVDAQDYVFFPAKGLQGKFDQLGELKGKQFEITKAEGDDNRNYWVIKDAQGNDITPDTSYSTPAKKNAPSPNLGLQDDTVMKIRVAFKGLEERIKELEKTVHALQMLLTEDQLKAFDFHKCTSEVGKETLEDTPAPMPEGI